MARVKSATLAPSAARLTTSLRDIGYDFQSAIADLVDNSIAADAHRVDVVIEYDGADSRVFVADDGVGMSTNRLLEALRFGSRSVYAQAALGRYGLGLKTASLSQCRSMTVASRMSSLHRRLSTRVLDLDVIQHFDDWLVVAPNQTNAVRRAHSWLENSPGTVVLWEKLDRVMPASGAESGWARRRFESLVIKVAAHLAMVFHRFLEGDVGAPLVLTVNGEKLQPWNPFGAGEPATAVLPELKFELSDGPWHGHVRLERYVLPPKLRFSSPEEFERLSGPMKWNRQQGLYIYRADRLVQWGGWAGIRAIDEHTKLARAALHFGTELDEAFQINVAKMRVGLPAELRQMVQQPLHELSLRADRAYRLIERRHSRSGSSPTAEEAADGHTRSGGINGAARTAGIALRAAAAQTGDYEALKRIAGKLRENDAATADTLGL